jgi:hypothetical protein
LPACCWVGTLTGGGHSHGLSDDFDHVAAQKYELNHSRMWLKDNFKRLYPDITDKARQRAVVSEEFFTDRESWEKFISHIEGKTCLEIGSGPAGALTRWFWAGKRVIVDPLANQYKQLSLEMFGKSWFTDDMELVSAPAEDIIPALVGKVDGVIVCRNALDHCARPMDVLATFEKYAVPGCYLLLWSDLWHLHGHNEGHTNITQDVEAFKADIAKLGFRIDHSFKNTEQETLNYGCTAIKE